MFDLTEYLKSLDEEELERLLDMVKWAALENTAALIICAELGDKVDYDHLATAIKNELLDYPF